jgi:hypothetical protein
MNHACGAFNSAGMLSAVFTFNRWLVSRSQSLFSTGMTDQT